MFSKFELVTPVALPPQCGIISAYQSTNLADAFAIALPASASNNPELLARHIFSHQPSWVHGLMKVRDALVAGFGLKTGKHLATLAGSANAKRVGIFKIYSTSPTEIILGEDDKHLDFRISVLRAAKPAADGNHQLVVSTVVHCHNRLGRAYIFLIAPFHRMVVRNSLRRAARVGWPPAVHSPNR